AAERADEEHGRKRGVAGRSASRGSTAQAVSAVLQTVARRPATPRFLARQTSNEKRATTSIVVARFVFSLCSRLIAGLMRVSSPSRPHAELFRGLRSHR